MLWIPINFSKYYLKEIDKENESIFINFFQTTLKSKGGKQSCYNQRIPWCVLNHFPPGFHPIAKVCKILLLEKSLYTGTPSIIRKSNKLFF